MTINTPNRALIDRMFCEGFDPDCSISAEELNYLLDAARAEGPVQGDLRAPGATDAQMANRAKLVTPPADEVGRAVERLHEESRVKGGISTVGASDLRLILSHVSRLEGDREGWRKLAEKATADALEDQRKHLAAEASLRLAVEALEKARGQFQFYTEQHSAKGTHDGDQKAATNFAIVQSIDATLASLSSLRPSVSTPGGDVDALEGLIEANKPFVAMLHALREDEGDSVTLLCDNPEGPPNNAIVCNGGWTDWEDRRFNGETIEQAVRLAYLAKRSPIRPPLAPTNMDTSGQSGGEG